MIIITVTVIIAVQAIRNAAAQNEHLLLRNINLQLMDEHAPPVYLRYNKELETMLHCEEKELRKVAILNHFRKLRISFLISLVCF